LFAGHWSIIQVLSRKGIYIVEPDDTEVTETILMKNAPFQQVCVEIIWDRISGIMVSMLASSAVNRGFEHRSGQTKDYKIGISCFSTKHAALRRKSKDLLARNQNNVSEWSDMSTRRLLFQWASTIKIQLSVLV
jgi:hypothetical protein